MTSLRRHGSLASFLLVGAAAASTVLAQGGIGGGVAAAEGGKLEPPTPTFKTEASGSVMPIVWAVLIIGVAVGVNLIPTKRGHQD